jgi:hypothetical protein
MKSKFTLHAATLSLLISALSTFANQISAVNTEKEMPRAAHKKSETNSSKEDRDEAEPTRGRDSVNPEFSPIPPYDQQDRSQPKISDPCLIDPKLPGCEE